MSQVETADALALREAKAEVVRSREQLVASGMALRSELRRSLEWRAWYRRAPLAALGLVFMAGFLWGGRRVSRTIDTERSNA